MALNAVRMKKKVVLIVEKVSELERILAVAKLRGVAAAPRNALQALRARLGQVGEVRRRGRQVRADDARDARGGQDPEVEADARLPRHAPLPHRLADHRHPEDQERDPEARARLREAARRSACRSSTWTSAAASASTTTARRRRSTRRSTTPCRSTRTTSSTSVQQICEEEKVPPPILVTESGRAVTAYHSVFVTNVLDVADRIDQGRRVAVHPNDATVLAGARLDLRDGQREEPARELPRRAPVQGGALHALQPRPPLPRGPVEGRDPLLADLRADPQAT